MKNTVKFHSARIGGLSSPSKMPCHSWSTPASKCQLGSLLRALGKHTVCGNCYAEKGMYVFPVVKKALQRRYDILMDASKRQEWIDSMVWLLNYYADKGSKFFRWHDSGDIQGVWHLDLIAEVCRKTPRVKHWIPTREVHILREAKKQGFVCPENLTIRISAMHIGQAPIASEELTSTVGHEKDFQCEAYSRGGKCGDCRACWTPTVRNVNYPKH